MKRNLKEEKNVNSNEPNLNTSRIEVPYLFGTLVLTPYFDEETQQFNGMYTVCDEVRGHCFGIICIRNQQDIQTELEKTVKCTTKLKSKKSISSQSNNAPCTSREADERKYEITAKRSIDDLENEQTKGGSKRTRTSKTSLKSKPSKELIKPRADNTIAQLLWGVLNFYSNKKLIYTHYLWGNDYISINAESLQNVSKFSLGVAQIESLADDFRYILGKGFTLRKKEGKFSKIEFKRSDEEKKANFKILNSNKEFEINTSDPVLIYDGNTIMDQLNEKVTNIDDGYRFVDSLYLVIVINNSFLRKMGITMERITRKSAELMPYYLVLKLNTEFDALNTHLISKLNIN